MSRFLPIIGFLIAIGLFFGYIDPTYKNSITALKAEIKNYDNALEAAERFKTKESELLAARGAINPEQLKRLEAFLPDGVDNVQLILNLDALAARSGMRLANYNTSAPSTPAGNEGTQPNGTLILRTEQSVDSIELTMTGTGTYAAFRTFLAGIEGSLRPLDLVALDVKSAKTGVYTYNMTLRLYWLR